MIRETDLPRSDCGAALRERPMDADELLFDPALDEDLIVAERVTCDARSYQKRTLTRVQRSKTTTSERGVTV